MVYRSVFLLMKTSFVEQQNLPVFNLNGEDDSHLIWILRILITLIDLNIFLSPSR